MTGQRVGYIRVSSILQNEERQLEGVALDCTFLDKASGKDTKRPELKRCLEHLRSGDTLIVHSIDRLCRSLRDLENLLAALTERGVTVEFHKESMVFPANGKVSPTTKLMLQMLGSFAEFERSIIRERQAEGIALAKAKGKYKGRRRALTDKQAAELKSRAEAGESKTKLADEYGISRYSVYQYLKRNT